MGGHQSHSPPKKMQNTILGDRNEKKDKREMLLRSKRSSPFLAQKQGRFNLKRDLKVAREDDKLSGSAGPSPASIRQEKLKVLENQRPTLTPHQVELVLESWKLIQQNTTKVGSDMFARLFTQYPDTKGAFSIIFKTMSPEDAGYETELRAHGTRVLRTVQVVLDKFSNEEEMVAHLHNLGRTHMMFNAKADYIDLIGPQFLFAVEDILKDRWNPDLEGAWSQLFKLIGHIMREAMMI